MKRTTITIAVMAALAGAAAPARAGDRNLQASWRYGSRSVDTMSPGFAMQPRAVGTRPMVIGRRTGPVRLQDLVGRRRAATGAFAFEGGGPLATDPDPNVRFELLRDPPSAR